MFPVFSSEYLVVSLDKLFPFAVIYRKHLIPILRLSWLPLSEFRLKLSFPVHSQGYEFLYVVRLNSTIDIVFVIPTKLLSFVLLLDWGLIPFSYHFVAILAIRKGAPFADLPLMTRRWNSFPADRPCFNQGIFGSIKFNLTRGLKILNGHWHALE